MSFAKMPDALESEFRYANPAGFPNRDLLAYYATMKAVMKEGAVPDGPRANWQAALARVREKTEGCTLRNAKDLERNVFTWLDTLPLPKYHTQYTKAIKKQRSTYKTETERQLCNKEYKLRQMLVELWSKSPRNPWYRQMPNAEVLETKKMEVSVFKSDGVRPVLPPPEVVTWRHMPVVVPDAFTRLITVPSGYDKVFALQNAPQRPASVTSQLLLQDCVRATAREAPLLSRDLLYALVMDVPDLLRVRALADAVPSLRRKWRVVVLNETLQAPDVQASVAAYADMQCMHFALDPLEFVWFWKGPPFDLVCVDQLLPPSFLTRLHAGSSVVMTSATPMQVDNMAAFAKVAAKSGFFLHNGVVLPLEGLLYCAFSLFATE